MLVKTLLFKKKKKRYYCWLNLPCTSNWELSSQQKCCGKLLLDKYDLKPHGSVRYVYY